MRLDKPPSGGGSSQGEARSKQCGTPRLGTRSAANEAARLATRN